MKHRIKVNLITRKNRKEELLTKRTVSLPGRLVAALFGNATQILILKPGQTVETVEFHEVYEKN